MSTAPDAAPMRVLVADDEPNARATLVSLVERAPGLELVATCANGEEAIAETQRLAPDLLVLDVRMPGADGLAVVASLPEDARPLVVFATAHDDHAVEAFDLHAVDYLLKPFDDARFEKALERARARRREEGPDEGRLRIGRVIGEGGEDRIAIHREGQLVLVSFDELERVEAADQYVRLFRIDGTDELMRASMGHLEKRLASGRFLRVHRSAIVRLDRVRELRSATSGTGRLTLESGADVPVSRTRLALVRRALG
ncbi:MAG: LytTR family DNA-binding domain-containing protein [Planctomycetota bacterium]